MMKNMIYLIFSFVNIAIKHIQVIEFFIIVNFL